MKANVKGKVELKIEAIKPDHLSMDEFLVLLKENKYEILKVEEGKVLISISKGDLYGG